MEFWTSVRVIVRRWYLVVPCLLLTLVLGGYLVHTAKPAYKATGSVLLSGSGRAARPATTPSTVAAVNPYANMDQSQLAYLVSQAASSSIISDQMATAGATSTFSVVSMPNEPAMTVSTTAETPESALRSYRTLITLLNAELGRRQLAVGAPSNTFVGVQNWTIPTAATPQNAAKVKALILVVGVGLLLTLGLTFLVDALLANGVPWSRSSEEEPDEAEAATDELPTGPVAVPAHIELDDLDDVNLDEVDDDDRAYLAAHAQRAGVRSVSRYDLVQPRLAERGSGSVASEDQRREGLPPWVPPEGRARASGS